MSKNCVELEDVPPYSLFASCYDRMMRHVDYRAWAGFVHRQAKKQGMDGGRVVDVACGTGLFLSYLREYGYNGSGIDLSEAMLDRAAERLDGGGFDFSRQDMRGFSVDSPADLVVCLHDSFNYLLEYGDLVRTLVRIREALRPGGVAVFDVSTRYNIRHNFSGRVFSEDTPDFSFIWVNRYNPFTAIARVEIDFLVKGNGTARPGREIHLQKIHSRRTIRRAIAEVEGLELVDEFGGLEEVRVTRRSVCLSYVLRKTE